MRCAIVALMCVCLFGARVSAQENMVAKVPAAHIAAVRADCLKKDGTAARCDCIVNAMGSSREGAVMLDVAGLLIVKPGVKPESPEIRALRARYSMSDAEFNAVVGDLDHFAWVDAACPK